MTGNSDFITPYDINPAYSQRVAYFCMEFAIHQSLKIYSGGLGFLAGSHMRSAYELKQNIIGIGILWSDGYYDQERDEDNMMEVRFRKKQYAFLSETPHTFMLTINGEEVAVKVWYLSPDTFQTAPVFLLSTDMKENSDVARNYTRYLYDKDEKIRIAQYLILGLGGAKLIDILGGADIYHLNEGHGLASAFYLLSKWNDINKVRRHVVFTTHTPEMAGNEMHDMELMNRIGFFNSVPLDLIKYITHTRGNYLGYTPSALYLSKIANGVSKLHGEVAREMWKEYEGISPIISVTNAQNKTYWANEKLNEAVQNNNDDSFLALKKQMKKELFEIVADQTGKIFNPDTLTIVWARRFASYKRANILLRDKKRFLNIINNTNFPVQIIWAGKPYPYDTGAINIFNELIEFSGEVSNCAVLTGYELSLSAILKKGADVWLNTPRRPKEASGTSGMTAAMNGAINFSVNDGWIPEFAKHGENAFIVPAADHLTMTADEIDAYDYMHLMEVLENEIIPAFYTNRQKWMQIIKQSMQDIYPYFDSNRMADEYYKFMYQVEYNSSDRSMNSLVEEKIK